MTYVLKVQNEAVLDIQEAYEWYEKKRAGLGDEFIAEIEYCLEKITANPQYYSFAGSSEKFRRIKTRRFPYMIVYEIEAGFVIVVAARNTWMKPLF
jgi:toxin ParE1/3/4